MPTRGAQFFDLRQDVRRQEDRLPALARLVDATPELLLHQRVEAARRFVEQQHVGPPRECGHEGDLLPVALGVGPGPLREVEFEPFDEFAAVGLVDAALQSGEQFEALFTGEARPEADVTGHVGQVGVHLGGAGNVDALDLGAAGRRFDQPEEESERRRLARAVRAEEAEHLALGDVERQIVQRNDRSEPLRQPVHADRRSVSVPSSHLAKP